MTISCLCILLSCFTISVIAQNNDLLFPYGSSVEFTDSMMLRKKDDHHETISISNPFKFAGESFDEVFVFNDGFVSFSGPRGRGEPQKLDIRPLQADVDIRLYGDGYFRTSDQGTDQTTCNKAEHAIRNATPEFLGRSLLTILVVSWIEVPVFLGTPSSTRSTFQVLIGTDGELTYVIFNYEKIDWSSYSVGISDSDGNLLIDLSDVDLLSTSNYGVPGSWIFEISDTFREIGKVQCQLPNPCLNGGTCMDNKCVCAEGFRGNFCHLVDCGKVTCMNLASCHNDQCHCTPGFTGSLCEDSECDNPCLNGASCEQGSCSCQAGFTGNMCQDKLTSVECGSSSMTVNIDRQLVTGDAAGIHFIDQSCSGVDGSSTEITLSTAYDQCGTTFEEDNTTITFSNVITYAKPGSENGIEITRDYQMQVKVECSLNKEEIISGSFRPQLGKVAFSDKGSGHFSLRLERFQTEAFGDLEVDPTSVVLLQQDLFFAVNLESVSDVGMFIDHCWATTTQDSDTDPQYSLISSGCPDDETVAIYRLFGLDREGFSFRAFVFVGDYTEVYIHCSVKVCGVETAQSIRDAGCPSESGTGEASPAQPPASPSHPNRKRRSSSFMSTHTISNGPIHIRRSTSDMATNDLSSYNPFAMLLLGMIATLVAMAILMGVVKLVRISTDISYQRVPIESMEGVRSDNNHVLQKGP